MLQNASKCIKIHPNTSISMFWTKILILKESGNGFEWCGKCGVPRGSVFKLVRTFQLKSGGKNGRFLPKIPKSRIFPYFLYIGAIHWDPMVHRKGVRSN